MEGLTTAEKEPQFMQVSMREQRTAAQPTSLTYYARLHAYVHTSTHKVLTTIERTAGVPRGM
jgi:hypothetical protein